MGHCGRNDKEEHDLRQILDSKALAPRYVPVLNTGGHIPNFAVDVPAKEFRMQLAPAASSPGVPHPMGGPSGSLTRQCLANPRAECYPGCRTLSGDVGCTN